jgi:hypothetical protein
MLLDALALARVGVTIQKLSYFGHTYSAGRAIAAAENVVVDVERSPLVIAYEALGRPMVGTTKGFFLPSIGLV